MPCRKFRFRKTSTRWLWEDWEGLNGRQLKLKLLERMANSAEGRRKFWSNVDKGIDKPCWTWTAAVTPRNYGIYSMRPRTDVRVYIRAHRVAYFLEHHVYADDLCVCHTCDNPRCVNPNHLFLGTSPDNTYDRNQKERQARGEGHGMAILTEKQVLEIREIREICGIEYKELARQYKVSWYTICEIVKRKSWKHLLH
jgi:hypothetical protein